MNKCWEDRLICNCFCQWGHYQKLLWTALPANSLKIAHYHPIFPPASLTSLRVPLLTMAALRHRVLMTCKPIQSTRHKRCNLSLATALCVRVIFTQSRDEEIKQREMSNLSQETQLVRGGIQSRQLAPGHAPSITSVWATTSRCC